MLKSKPRLLFLSHCLPYPADEGVKIRTFNVLRLLSKRFDVRAMCFYRKAGVREGGTLADAVAHLSRYARVQTYAIPQERSRLRLVRDHLRSLLHRRAYTFYTYRCDAFSTDLNAALEEFKPDLIHVDSLDMSPYLDQLIGRFPVVCTHHNVESALLKRRSDSLRGLRRQYLQMQSELTEREERTWLARVSLNVAVSDADRTLLQRMSPSAPFMVVPNGVDTTQVSALGDATTGIVFVGGSTWFPNRDALEYFTSSILPHLRERVGAVPVTWVGDASPSDRERMLREHGVVLTGYVKEIEPFVRNAACYVVPLRVGGGTRLKILYAWAMARAVVSTSVGCEGLDARDGQNILIEDNPEQFAEAIARVLQDRELRLRLAQAGRQTAERKYDWKVLGEAMLPSYLALAGVSGLSTPAQPES